MKKLLLSLLFSLALAATARATDVAIGPSTIPGFNPASVPADVTLTASVIGGSPTVTSAAKFSPWVGLGGFRISILGVPYTVAYVTNASTLTLTTNYAAGDNPTATVVWYKYVELRIYPDSAFQPFGKTYIVQPGTPGSGAWYRRVAASIVNEFGINNLYIPQITLDATTDSLTNQSARYYAAFYRPGGGFIQGYECFDSFALPPTGASTWPDICLFNSQQVIVQDSTTYTKTQIDSFRTGCTIGQSLFYAVTGLKPACLNIGTGLLLTGDTLTATSGNQYHTIQEEGAPLTQRSFLNFAGSGLTATDNAGASRTDVTVDSDLNALASNATNGFWVRTGAGTGAARLFTAPAAGFTITNNDGVAGNPTFVLANDLAGLEGLAGTGGAYRTAADTWTNRTLQQPAAGLTITNPAGVAGDPTFALANDLGAVEGLSTNGIATRTASDTWTTRTITGTTGQVALANGSGVSGDPTVSLPTTVFLGTAGGSPAAGALTGPDASGTNIAGASLELSGGKGTGNAAPGRVVVRYPLVGASGATLQSLSTDRYPVTTSLYTNTTNGTAIANTTTETSYFTGVTASAESTRTIEGGVSKAGTIYRVRAVAAYATTGTPTGRFRLKLGSVTIADTTAVTLQTVTNASLIVTVDIHVNSIGATGTVGQGTMRIELGNSFSGGQTLTVIHAVLSGTVDFTANQTIDLTFQWGTASASNTTTLTEMAIERIR